MNRCVVIGIVLFVIVGSGCIRKPPPANVEQSKVVVSAYKDSEIEAMKKEIKELRGLVGNHAVGFAALQEKVYKNTADIKELKRGNQ